MTDPQTASARPVPLGARSAPPPQRAAVEADEGASIELRKGSAVGRFLFRGSVIGTVVSVLVHLCFVLISAILLFEVAKGSLPGRAGADVTITMETGAEIGQLPAPPSTWARRASAK